MISGACVPRRLKSLHERLISVTNALKYCHRIYECFFFFFSTRLDPISVCFFRRENKKRGWARCPGRLPLPGLIRILNILVSVPAGCLFGLNAAELRLVCFLSFARNSFRRQINQLFRLRVGPRPYVRRCFIIVRFVSAH